jgi:hypothetical protein
VLIELYPDRYPRRKTPAEVNAMLQQYEQQLPVAGTKQENYPEFSNMPVKGCKLEVSPGCF